MFKAHRLVYHSTLVIKKKKKTERYSNTGSCAQSSLCVALSGLGISPALHHTPLYSPLYHRYRSI